MRITGEPDILIRIEKWLEFIAEADGEILGKGKGVTVVNYPFIDCEDVIAIAAGQRKSVVIAAFDGVCIDGTVGNGDLGLGFLGAACVGSSHTHRKCWRRQWKRCHHHSMSHRMRWEQGRHRHRHAFGRSCLHPSCRSDRRLPLPSMRCRLNSRSEGRNCQTAISIAGRTGMHSMCALIDCACMNLLRMIFL